MRLGIRKPSLRGRISARTSWKRIVRHQMGFKAPRGFGFFTNPKKAIYNRVYSRATVSVDDLLKPGRAISSSKPLGSPEFGENAVTFALAGAIMIGLMVWIGFSFKLAFILTAFGIAGAVFGAEVVTGVLILAFVAWVFLH